MQFSKYKNLLKVIIFFGLSMFLYIFVLSNLFLDIENWYKTSTFYNWLIQFVDPKIAAGALKRFSYFIWGLALFVFFVKYIDKRTLSSSILNKPKHHKFKYFMAGFITQVLIIVIGLTMSLKIDGVTLNLVSTNPLPIILHILFAGIIIGFNVLTEELLFRGYFLEELKKEFNIHITCIISSILFMIAHPFHQYGLYGILVQVGAWGLIFGYIADYYKNIYVTTGLHLANNVITRTISSSMLFYFLPDNYNLNFGIIYQTIYMIAFAIWFIYIRSSISIREG